MNDTSFRMDRRAGGRLSSFTVGGLELLVQREELEVDKPTSWGAFPMVPWAGRIDHGRFTFEGHEYRMPINHPPHAIHGTLLEAEWTEVGPGHLACELGDPWPFGGTVSHVGSLIEHEGGTGRLDLELAVMAADHPMPVMVGWHPWFRRRLTADGPLVRLVIDDFDHSEMYTLDDDSIPTGSLTSPPPPGPWDNPFRQVRQPIALVWDSQLRIDLTSDCDHWVIYDRPRTSLCVEPQSAPPDVFNPNRFDVPLTVLGPGESFTRTFTITWRTL